MFFLRGLQIESDESAWKLNSLPLSVIGHRPSKCRAARKGFSLIELLLVIVLASILVKFAISSASSTIYDQLKSAANVVVGELAYGRSLAVGNNTSYRFDLDTTNNRLVMRHTGADSTLNTLPASPFRSPSDPSDQAILDLGKLPHLGMQVTLLGAQAVSTTTQNITTVEFGPYGATTQANQTVIWLAAGNGSAARYFSVTVNPITGLSALGSYGSTVPTELVVVNH